MQQQLFIHYRKFPEFLVCFYKFTKPTKVFVNFGSSGRREVATYRSIDSCNPNGSVAIRTMVGK